MEHFTTHSTMIIAMLEHYKNELIIATKEQNYNRKKVVMSMIAALNLDMYKKLKEVV